MRCPLNVATPHLQVHGHGAPLNPAMITIRAQTRGSNA